MKNPFQKRHFLKRLAALSFAFGYSLSLFPVQAQLGEMGDSPPKVKAPFALPPSGALPLNSVPTPKQIPSTSPVTERKDEIPQPRQTTEPETAIKEEVPERTAETVSPAATAAQNPTPVQKSTLPAVSNKTAAVSTEIKSLAKPGFQEYQLPNGLKVLILEHHEFPVVSTLIWYHVGSRDEEPGSTGICHLVEHLLFQNVGSFQNGAIGSSIARYGGQFNGYTSDDFTTFFETLPANKLELALKIESERMRQARFTSRDLQQEVSNIQKELDTESKDPLALLSKEVRALMFMQHPYHNPTIGWRSDVENLKLEQLKPFYDRFFQPNNATLIIAGDVDGKSAIELIQKYFAAIPKPKDPITHVSVTEPLPHSERRVNLKYDGKQELMQIAYRSPALSDNDSATMVVIEKLLNGSSSGRLKSKLLETKICSTATASYEIKREPGLFTITGIAAPASGGAQQKIQDGVDAVISQLKEKPIADAELQRAKNSAEFAFNSECDGPYRAGFHLGYFDSLSDWQAAKTWTTKIHAVSSQDVLRVAKRYFNSDARVIGWIAGTSAPRLSAPKTTGTSDSQKEKEKAPPPKRVEHTNLTGYKEDDFATAPVKNKDKKTGIPAVIRDLPMAVGNAVTGNIPGAVSNVGSALINIPSAIGDISSTIGNTATAISKIALLHQPATNEQQRAVKRILKNGIVLYVFESHVSPIVQINGYLEAGDIYNPSGKPGLSAVVSSLLNQGSAKHSRAQFQASQEDMGIPSYHMLRFENEPETIDFQTRCLSRNLQTQLDLLAETLISQVGDESLDKAKQEALSIYRRGEDNLSQKVDRALMQSLLIKTSPLYPADPLDKSKSIAGITFPEIQKFTAANIGPATTKIVITGDITPDQARVMVEKSFAGWENKTNHTVSHAHPNSQRVLRTSIPLKDSRKSVVCYGQLITLSPTHSDYGNLLIADNILINHPIISRFEQQISKSPALETAVTNSDINVRLVPIANITAWSFSATTEPGTVPSLVKTIKQELRSLSKTGITQEELNEAKRYLLGSLPVKTASTLSSISRSMLDSAEHGDTADGLSLQLAGIKQATTDSVNRILRTTFKPELSTLVVAGPAQSIHAARQESTAKMKEPDKKPSLTTKSPSDKS